MNKGKIEAEQPPLARFRCPVRGCYRRFSSESEKDAHLYQSGGKAHERYLQEHGLEENTVPRMLFPLQEKQSNTTGEANKENAATKKKNPKHKKKNKVPQVPAVVPAWSAIGPMIEALSKQEIIACLEKDWKGAASLPLLTTLAESRHYAATTEYWDTQEDVTVMLQNNWYCEDVHEYLNIKSLLEKGETKLSFRTANDLGLEIDLEELKNCQGKLDRTVEGGGCSYCNGSAEIKLRLKSNGVKTRLIVIEELFCSHACYVGLLQEHEDDRRRYEVACHRYCIARGEDGEEEVSLSDDEIWFSD